MRILILCVVTLLFSTPVMASSEEDSMNSLMGLYKKVSPTLNNSPVIASAQDCMDHIKEMKKKYGENYSARMKQPATACRKLALGYASLKDKDKAKANEFLEKAAVVCTDVTEKAFPEAEVDSGCASQCVQYQSAPSCCMYMCVK